MAINKVVDRNGNTVIDLTDDTLTPEKVLSGERFHGADGEIYYGKALFREHNKKTIKFINKYCDLLYEYTLEEIMALNELPPYPITLGENEVFYGWNWSLEDLQTLDWERTYEYPVVAALIDDREKEKILSIKIDSNQTFGVYFGAFIYNGGKKESINLNNTYKWFTVDWGDGTTNTYSNFQGTWTSNHKYVEAGEYIIRMSVDDTFLEEFYQKYPDNHTLLFDIADSYSGNILSSKVLKDPFIYRYDDYIISFRENGQSINDVFIALPNCAASLSEKDYKYISIPKNVSNIYKCYTANCPGCGFIPNSANISYTSSPGIYSPCLYDGDIISFDDRNIGFGLTSAQTILNSALILSEPRIPIIRKIDVKCRSFGGLHDGQNSRSCFPMKFLEEVSIYDYSNSYTRCWGYSNSYKLESLKKFKINQTKRISVALFNFSPDESAQYLMKWNNNIIVDLTNWTGLPEYDGGAKYDPIFGVISLEKLLLKNPRPVVKVRESLLDKFKTTQSWNIIADLYEGVPDEECED